MLRGGEVARRRQLGGIVGDSDLPAIAARGLATLEAAISGVLSPSPLYKLLIV